MTDERPVRIVYWSAESGLSEMTVKHTAWFRIVKKMRRLGWTIHSLTRETNP